MESLAPLQALNRETHAVHAAAFWIATPGSCACERMSAGTTRSTSWSARWRGPACRSREGLLLLTSRVSVEMVQKAAMVGLPALVAVSAPTALAVRTADAAGITLVAIARGDGFEVFAHPQRIAVEAVADVA